MIIKYICYKIAGKNNSLTVYYDNINPLSSEQALQIPSEVNLVYWDCKYYYYNYYPFFFFFLLKYFKKNQIIKLQMFFNYRLPCKYRFLFMQNQTS